MDAATTESQSSAPNQLIKYGWISAAKAIFEYRKGNKILEALRNGHGLLAPDTFVEALWTQEIEVIAFENDCAVLITWGECENGKTLSVLTVAGSVDRCIDAWPTLEHAAKLAGAKVIMSVGEIGWRKFAQRQGYETCTKLFMRKTL